MPSSAVGAGVAQVEVAASRGELAHRPRRRSSCGQSRRFGVRDALTGPLDIDHAHRHAVRNAARASASGCPAGGRRGLSPRSARSGARRARSGRDRATRAVAADIREQAREPERRCSGGRHASASSSNASVSTPQNTNGDCSPAFVAKCRRIVSRYAPESSCVKHAANASARRSTKSGACRSAGPRWNGWKNAPGTAANTAQLQPEQRIDQRVFDVMDRRSRLRKMVAHREFDTDECIRASNYECLARHVRRRGSTFDALAEPALQARQHALDTLALLVALEAAARERQRERLVVTPAAFEHADAPMAAAGPCAACIRVERAVPVGPALTRLPEREQQLRATRREPRLGAADRVDGAHQVVERQIVGPRVERVATSAAQGTRRRRRAAGTHDDGAIGTLSYWNTPRSASTNSLQS